MILSIPHLFNENIKDKRCVGIFLFFCGVILFLSIIFIQYNIIESFKSADKITLTETQLEFMNSIAIPSFMLYIISIVLCGLGIIINLSNWMKATYFSYSTSRIKIYWYIFKSGIFLILNNSYSRKILITSFFIYLLSSLFLNNSIVYKSEISFFASDIVEGPIVFIVGCCGSPGTFPVITIHITNHLGVILIPINLIIPIFFSFLVSLTVSTITLIAKSNKIKKNICNRRANIMTSFGIVSGLFIGCPTCAVNILFLSIFSTGSILTILTVSLPILSFYLSLIIVFNFVFMIGIMFVLMRKYLYEYNKDIKEIKLN